VPKYHGRRDWQSICVHVPGRSNVQCCQRWPKINPCVIRKLGKLSSQERDALMDAMLDPPTQCHKVQWAKIAQQSFPGRSGVQLRQFWSAITRQLAEKGPFSKDELSILSVKREEVKRHTSMFIDQTIDSCFCSLATTGRRLRRSWEGGMVSSAVITTGTSPRSRWWSLTAMYACNQFPFYTRVKSGKGKRSNRRRRSN
jgi:hypothetical protein